MILITGKSGIYFSEIPGSKIWTNFSVIICFSPSFCFAFCLFSSLASFSCYGRNSYRIHFCYSQQSLWKSLFSWLFQEKSGMTHWLGLSCMYTLNNSLWIGVGIYCSAGAGSQPCPWKMVKSSLNHLDCERG